MQKVKSQSTHRPYGGLRDLGRIVLVGLELPRPLHFVIWAIIVCMQAHKIGHYRSRVRSEEDAVAPLEVSPPLRPLFC